MSCVLKEFLINKAKLEKNRNMFMRNYNETFEKENIQKKS